MLRKAALFVLTLCLIPAAFSLCPRDVYHATPSKNLDVITLSAFDLDARAKGVQSSIAVAPMQRITGRLAWKFGPLAEGDVRVNLFGNWSGAEIARLYSGSALPNQSTSVEFSFFAPSKPGSYTLTAVFAFDSSFAADAEASNLCSQQRCSSSGRCAVVFATTSLQVLNTTPALYVEITSPSEGDAFSVGEVVTINATVVPVNASVALYINGSLVGEALPYRWNTSGMPPGEYPILVNASFGNRSAFALVRMELLNLSLKEPEHYEIILPRQPEQVYATASSLVALAGDEVYVLKPSGEMVSGIKFGAKPLISAAAEHFVVAEGSRITLYNSRGTTLWNSSLDAAARMVAASERGVGVVAGGKLYLFNAAGALLWTKTLSSTPDSLAVGNRSIAIASNRTVHLLSYDGAPIWNASFKGRVRALAISDDTLFVLLGDEVRAFKEGKPVLNLSLADNATMLSVWGGRLLASSTRLAELYDLKGRLLWRYHPHKGVRFVALSKDGAFILTGDGRILAAPHPRGGGLHASRAALAAIVIAALALLLILGRRARAAARVRRVVGEETLPVEVTVRSSKGRPPVEGALVKLDKLEGTTNSRGVATFRVKPGTLRLSVEKAGFKPASRKFSLKRGSGVEVELEPELSLSQEQERHLEELRNRIEETYESITGEDTCLPNYFRSIGHGIIDGVEALIVATEFGRKPENSGALIRAAESAVPMICEAMLDWRNVALASGRHSEGCTAPEFTASAAVDFLLGSLGEEDLEKELLEVDRELTSRIGELSIHPPASLWRISKKLLEKGKGASPPLSNSLFAISHYLLLCARHMLSSDELVSRLRRSIF